jgi:N-acetylneuraminic acid mutarotase
MEGDASRRAAGSRSSSSGTPVARTFFILSTVVSLAVEAGACTRTSLLPAGLSSHASEVLGGAGFTSSSTGFSAKTGITSTQRGAVEAAEAALTVRSGLRLHLPLSAKEPVRLSFPGGRSIEVRERGVAGEGRLVEGAVAYDWSGGTSFWRSTELGYEEWIALTDAHAGPLVEWQVDGADLEQDGEGVLVTSGAGGIAIRVTAPTAYGRDGRPVRTWLRASGHVLALHTDARGPALVDPLWVATPNMAVAHQWHTATLLHSGKVLIAGGESAGVAFIGQPINTAELYDPTTGTWTAAAPMQVARILHTATLLPSGKVLVAGGWQLASAEIYDPNNDTWSLTGSMSVQRSDHTATLLNNGLVLVAGGYIGSGPSSLASAELYDSINGKWTLTGPMNFPRADHTATTLRSGHVLLAGSGSGTSETYDPSTFKFTKSGGSMTAVRANHSASLLPSGRVLVAGGSAGGAVVYKSAELYDPVSDSWTATGDMSTVRMWHAAVTLSTGTVLVMGGADGYSQPTGTAELYEEGTGWSSAGTMTISRAAFTATVLRAGNVLVAGGFGLVTVGGLGPAIETIPNAELYGQPGLQPQWQPTGSLTVARARSSATLLGSGEVLLAGGCCASSGASFATVDVYHPQSGGWAVTQPMAHARATPAAVALASGNALVVGGFDGPTRLSSAEMYDAGTRTWSSAGSLAEGRDAPRAVLLPNDSVLLAGGGDSSGGFPTSTYFFDPTTETWNTTAVVPPPMPSGRQAPTATVLLDGRILFAGGYTTVASADAALYDPAKNQWTSVQPMAAPRAGHTATALPSGKVLVTGGTDFVNVLASAELFDPDGGTWSPAPPMSTPRFNHVATLLPSGLVLVAAGKSASAVLASSEVLDPTNGGWSPSSSLITARTESELVRLLSGDVLVVGGDSNLNYGAPLASAELYPSGLLISPATVTIPPGGTQVFAGGGGSGTGFRWSLAASPSGGSVDPSSGRYLAGNMSGVGDVVQLVDSVGDVKTAVVTVAGNRLQISPTSGTVAPFGTLTFTASGGTGTGLMWSISSDPSHGSITDAGVYTAGSTGGVTDIVVVTDSSSASATATVTVTSSPGNPDAGSGGTGAKSGGGCASAGGEPLLALAFLLLPFLVKRPRRTIGVEAPQRCRLESGSASQP